MKRKDKISYILPDNAIYLNADDDWNVAKDIKINYKGKQIMVVGIVVLKCKENKELINDCLR